QSVPVLAALVTSRDMRQTLDVTGSLKTDEDVQIGTRIAGKVAEVTVKEGDWVQRGHVLVRLDERELRAQLARAQATLESAQAKLDSDNARQMFERRQTLFKQDAIAKEEVDNAERQYKSMQAQERVAAAAVAVAEQKLDLAKEGSRAEEIRIGEGQLNAANRAL